MSGPLDQAAVNEAAARLLVLDGAGGDPIAVLVNSPGGPLGEVAALLDVLADLRAPLEVTTVGRAHGTAGVLVAAAPGRRLAGPRATLSLRCDVAEAHTGSAADLVRFAGAVAAVRDGLVARLAERTGRPEAWLGDQLDRGGPLAAAAAVEAGLLDGLAAPTRPR
jgi:ATP-dependent Clp protease protease subunit